MKIFLSSLFIIFVAHLFVSYAQATDGCAYSDDLVAKPILSDHPACLKARTSSGCLENIKLIIQSSCDEVFTYEQEGVVRELYKYEDWLKVNQRNPRAEFEIIETLVPQDLSGWSKEIRYKGDPNKKISIQMSIEPKQPKDVYTELFKNIDILLLMLLIGGLSAFFILKFLNMMTRKLKRKRVLRQKHIS